jgi:hypothetical protein
MIVDSQLCERARRWASLRADDELSELESALLDAHLGHCLPCSSFARDAENIADALRGARLERPAPLAFVLPRGRPALQALQVTVAAALVVAAGAAAALVGVDRHGSAPETARPVVIVASDPSPDTVRGFRRGRLTQTRPVPRNRRLTDESV